MLIGNLVVFRRVTRSVCAWQCGGETMFVFGNRDLADCFTPDHTTRRRRPSSGEAPRLISAF